MSRRIGSAALIVVFALARVAAAPAGAVDLCSAAQFRCNGFEPNWQFTTGSDSAGGPVVNVLDPENPG